ncbi:MAG: prohibitin family protein [Chloroflexi bacterium]|nr:prohibitin family protein [Chloroflexota bacterium]
MITILQGLFFLAGIATLLLLMLGLKKDQHGIITGVEFRPWGLGVGLLVFLPLLFVSLSIGQVEAGAQGLLLKFGAPTGDVINPGAYFRPAILYTVVHMDTQTRAYSADAEAASADLQDVSTTVTVNYKLDPANVFKVYQDLRSDYVARIIAPSVQEAVKSVTAKYAAEQLITQRQKVKEDITTALEGRLAQKWIVLEAVSITNFSFSKVFQDAIELKQKAAQDALTAENKLRQIQVEAAQAKAQAEGQKDAAIAQAEGAKQSIILNAQGQAEATLTLAEAQAKANKLLSDSLSTALIQYTEIQKLSPDVKVIIAPPGTSFLFPTTEIAK